MGFTLSVEAQLLIERGRKMQPGETVSYDEWNQLVGVDVRADGRHFMDTARRRLQDSNIVLAPVPNQGFRRLTDDETAKSGESSIHKISREARRAVKRITSIGDFSKLSPEAQREHNKSLTVFGTVRHFVQPKEINRLAAAVEQSGKPLPLTQTLEHFSKKAGEK
jgi:hypothetical protein